MAVSSVDFFKGFFFLAKMKHLVSEEMFVLVQFVWETAGCLRAPCDQPHNRFYQRSPVCPSLSPSSLPALSRTSKAPFSTRSSHLSPKKSSEQISLVSTKSYCFKAISY